MTKLLTPPRSNDFANLLTTNDMIALVYLVKVSVCLGLFYGLYYFLFRRFTFHRLNRIYLLLTLVLSFMIPFIELEQKRILEITTTVAEPVSLPEKINFEDRGLASVNAPAETLDESISTVPETESWMATLIWEQWSMGIYGIGLLGMLILFVRRLLQIAFMYRKYQNNSKKEWIEVSDSFTAASFFGIVFLNSQTLTEIETKQVLLHEQTHARLLHSADILLVEVCKVILWFNPIVYLCKKSLAEIHEFEVDAQLATQFDAKTYAHLILKLATQSSHSFLLSFGKHPVTNRIQFLFQKPTIAMNKILYVFVLLLGVAGVWAFAPRKEVIVYKEMSLKTDSLQMGDKRRLKPFISTKKDLSPSENTQWIWGVEKKDNIRFDNVHKIQARMRLKGIFFKRVSIKANEGKDLLVFIPNGKGNQTAGLAVPAGKSPVYYLDGVKVKEEVVKSLRHDHITNVKYLEPEQKNWYVRFIKEHKIDAKNEKFVWMERAEFDFKKLPASNINKRLSLNSASADTIRTFLPANDLGKNPLVFINGEEMPASILTRVDPSKFGMSYIAKPNDSNAISKYGVRALDGVVDIKSPEDCFFKTENERFIAIENIKKTLNTSQERFSKITLRKADGGEFERIVIRSFVHNGPFVTDFPKNAKIIYMMDGKPVNERQIKNYKGKFQSAMRWKKTGGISKMQQKYGDLIADYDGGIDIKTTR